MSDVVEMDEPDALAAGALGFVLLDEAGGAMARRPVRVGEDA